MFSTTIVTMVMKEHDSTFGLLDELILEIKVDTDTLHC